MNAKKKILFIHHSSTIGGAGLSGLNVLRAIPKESYEVTVYCNSEQNGMADIYRDAGFNVIYAGKSPIGISHYSGGEVFVLSPHVLINLLYIYFDKSKISTLIQKIKPDIVIVNSMTLYWIGKIAKAYNAETICFFRETYAKNCFGLRNSIIRNGLNKYFDKISFISKYDLELNKGLNCSMNTIYNMIPSEEFTRHNRTDTKVILGLNDDSFNVLFVGGMSPLKGAIIAIKAISKTENKKIKLVFIGYKWNGRKKTLNDCDGFKKKIKYLLRMDYEAKAIKYILSNNLKNRILFYGIQRNIAPFFIACDALISPSTKPHQARPIFEAGFAKIPVIASDFPNIREVINEDSGFLFKNKNFTQAAAYLDAISTNTVQFKARVDLNYENTIGRHTQTVYNQGIAKLLK